MQTRVSQRLSLACRECQVKKKRCSKDIPCSRCIDLGLDCDREVVYLRRNIHRHGGEIQFLSSLRDTLQSEQESRVDKALAQLTRRIEQLRSGSSATAEDSPTEQAAVLEADATGSELEPQHGNVSSTSTSTLKYSPLITALEQVARGQSYGSYPLNYTDQYQGGSWMPFPITSKIIPTADLPDKHVAQTLIDYHLKHTAWHHNCLHTPTFLQECRTFWDTGDYGNTQWLALYCAVLAVSLFSLQNSAHFQEQYYLGSMHHTPSMLFDNMVDILHASHFLENPSLYSVQAIAISTDVAHSLGLSQLNSTLCNTAIGIAECLRLHKIADEDLAFTEVRGNIEAEVGRRVWLQLVIQDHFAISFAGSYKIHPSSYSTSLPRNANDDGLVGMPPEVLTVSTYNRALGTVARLMPELANGVGSVRDPKPIKEQYNHTKTMDQKLRECIQAFPKCLLQQDKALESHIPWLSVARHSLAITVAEKIIMIHRPFIFHSFQSETYSYTRRTCISAAMKILREQKALAQNRDAFIWTHSAFTITAALILSFQVRRYMVSEDENCTKYADAVQDALEFLESRRYDVLASRGVVLIKAILSMPLAIQHIAEESNVANVESASFEEILRRFSMDMAAVGFANQSFADFPPTEQPDIVDFHVTEPGEFEMWFQDIFYSTSFD